MSRKCAASVASAAAKEVFGAKQKKTGRKQMIRMENVDKYNSVSVIAQNIIIHQTFISSVASARTADGIGAADALANGYVRK